jgi:hypothetical protein
LEALVIAIAGDNPYDLGKTSMKDPQGIAETDFGQAEGSGGANITLSVNEAGNEEEPTDERRLTRSQARRGAQDVDGSAVVARAADSTQDKAKVMYSSLHSGIQNPTGTE